MRLRAESIWFLVWLLSGMLVAATWVGSSNVSLGRILVHTFGLAFLSFAIAAPLSLWCAYRWVAGSRLERGLVTLIVALALVPLCLQVAGWESVVARIRPWFLEDGNMSAMTVVNWTTAVWIHAASGVAWLTIFFAVGFWSRGWVLEQQALLDASPLRVFCQVTLVRLWPMLVAAALWMLVIVTREIAVADIYQIGTYAEQVYLGYALNRMPWSIELPENQSIMQFFGATRQFALVAFLIASALWAFRITLDHGGEETTRSPYRAPGRTRFLSVAVTSALWLLLFVLPIAALTVRSGSTTISVAGQLHREFSGTHLFEAIGKSVSDYRWPLFWSGSIGLSTALFTTGVSLAAAWIAVRRPSFANWLFFPLAAASFTVPYPVVGTLIDSMASSIELEPFRHLWDRSISGPVVANSCIAFGPVALMLYFAMRQSSQSVLESMATERAGAFSLFWNLGITANQTAIVATLGTAFLIAFGDVAASFQVVPAGIDTVARSILGQLHSGVDDLTAAISLASLIAAICLAFVIVQVFRRSQRDFAQLIHPSELTQ